MLKPKTYPALMQALEEGARLGYRRAFKHQETPSENQIIENITDACLFSILEWFDLEEAETK